MVRLGKIKPGENVDLPNKNAVTRAVGVREFVEIDTMEFDVLPEDRFLLCSDGLSGYFTSDGQILSMMQGEDVREITERTIHFAVEAGGKDNITAIVVDVEAEDEDEQQERSEKIELKLEVLKSTPFFQYLHYKELMQVLNLTHTSEFEAQEVIFEPTEEHGELFMVLRGAVALQDANGRELSALVMGDYTGAIGFVDAQPEGVRAVAREDALLMSLQRKQFMELLRSDPELAVKLLWNFLQTFSMDLRRVPTGMLLGAGPDEETVIEGEALSRTSLPDEGRTPPAGKLVFEEDRLGAEASEQPEPGDPRAGEGLSWGFEATRRSEVPQKVVIPGDGASSLAESTDVPEDLDGAVSPPAEEDLRETTEFRRADIQESLPPRGVAASSSPSSSSPPGGGEGPDRARAGGGGAPPPLPRGGGGRVAFDGAQLARDLRGGDDLLGARGLLSARGQRLRRGLLAAAGLGSPLEPGEIEHHVGAAAQRPAR